MQVTPSINCHFGDIDCVVDKLRKAERFAEWVHLDIADGIFTFNKSWGDAKEWQKLKPKVKFEVHLMFDKPEQVVEEWLKAGAARIIFHWETVRDHPAHVVHRDTEKIISTILSKCKKHKAEAMLAVNPETSLEEVRPYFKKFSAFQVFSQAHPGPPGQPFLKTILPKISELRRELPDATIEIDGGVNLDTARLAKDAGADTVIAGTYVLGSPDSESAYQELKNV